MEKYYELDLRPTVNGKKWRAVIPANDMDIKLGLFATKDQALAAIEAAFDALEDPNENFVDWYENYRLYTLGYKKHLAKVDLPQDVARRLRRLPLKTQKHIAGKYYGCRKVWNE